MLTLLKSLIHLIAAISLYIIMVVGLGWFWTIGTAEDYERINNVLVNLSYSFITGYLVFLFTILFPAKRRSRRINYIVAGKLRSIVQDDIHPCLQIFIPPAKWADSLSIDDVVLMFERGEIRRASAFTFATNKRFEIDVLCLHCKHILEAIDSIINDYSHDLSEDTLKILESIKMNPVHAECFHYCEQYFVRETGTLVSISPSSKRIIVLGFCTLKDSIEEWIARNQINKRFFHKGLKMINLFGLKDEIVKEDDVIKAFENQEIGKWSFFEERLHMETVFSQRVNFLLLLFPVLVAAFCTAGKSSPERLIISIAGFVTLLLFYIPLKRTFFKLDIIQKITYKIKMGDSADNNPIKFVHDRYKGIHSFKRFPDVSSYSLIMWGILFMMIFMLVLAVLSAFKVL